VLDIGVAEKFGGDRELLLFDANSLAVSKTMAFKTRGGPASDAGLLTFGGNGTKLVYYPSGSNAASGNSSGRGGSRGRSGASQDQQGQLYLIPLELTDDQKAELAKSFPPSKN